MRKDKSKTTRAIFTTQSPQDVTKTTETDRRATMAALSQPEANTLDAQCMYFTCKTQRLASVISLLLHAIEPNVEQ